MICNRELEKRLLAGLLQHPNVWQEISVWINQDDFPSEGSRINQTIFCIIRNALNSNEIMDEILVAERVKNLGISFEDNIDITEYILGLKTLNLIEENQVIEVARELKKVTFCRQIEKTGIELQRSAEKSLSLPLDDIIINSDKIYNKNINTQIITKREPKSIYSDMEENVEFLGENPIEDFGLKGPYKRLYELYGSLLRPGDITAIVARASAGKTQMSMQYCIKTSVLYDNKIPILHFDNGEMTRKDLQMRQCSTLSGVPLFFIETGKWRNNQDFVRRIRAVWPIVRNMKFDYLPVGGMAPDQMISELKRYYFGKVGRYNKETGEPNRLIFSFDYLKPPEGGGFYQKEYEVIGEIVQKFKTAIQTDIVTDKGEPVVSMFTSVQSNRTGIVNNKKSDELSDNEGQVSMSDRIIQYVSHLFLLRKKTTDELVNESNFGTHKLINLKARSLGMNKDRAIDLIKMPNSSLKRNDLHFEFKNFVIEEKGDTVDLIDSLSTKRSPSTLAISNNISEEDIP
jgi:hypothetical protein